MPVVTCLYPGLWGRVQNTPIECARGAIGGFVFRTFRRAEMDPPVSFGVRVVFGSLSSVF